MESEQLRKKKNTTTWYRLLDYVIIPLLIIIVAYQPGYKDGFIDHFEAGKELACVNELSYGKVICKDIFTQFGPLNTYLQAFFMFLFGKNLSVLRSYFYCGTLLTLIAGYLIGLSLCRRHFFSYILPLILIFETYHPFWATRWGGFRFAFGLLAIFGAIKFFAKKKKIWILLAGVFGATALLITQDVGVLSIISVGFTICLYLYFAFIEDKEFLWPPLIFFSIGIAIILAPFFMYFIFNGAFIPYIMTTLTVVTTHSSVWAQKNMDLVLLKAFKNSKNIFSFNFKIFFPILLYGCYAIYLLKKMSAKKGVSRDYGLMCLFVYGVLMYIASMRRVEGPQFQIALQPAMILTVVFLDRALERVVQLKKNIKDNNNFVKIAALGGVLLFMSYYVVNSEKRFYGSFSSWVRYQGQKKDFMPFYLEAIPISRMKLYSLTISRAKGVEIPVQQAPEIEGVTKYILSVTKQGEKVFTFPEHGIYNFLADRPCIDRFNIAGYAWTTPEYRKELLEDLEKSKPRYIIYGRELSNMAMAINRKKELLPEVIEYINKNYEKEISFGSIDILKRKGM